MAKRQVMFTFPDELVREPIIYTLSNQFSIVTNIRRADVSENRGWLVLELGGEEGERGPGVSGSGARPRSGMSARAGR